ncbi:MAG: hypothetical protein ACYDHY_04515 [Acidiferrobacterales bacterium]
MDALDCQRESNTGWPSCQPAPGGRFVGKRFGVKTLALARGRSGTYSADCVSGLDPLMKKCSSVGPKIPGVDDDVAVQSSGREISG